MLEIERKFITTASLANTFAYNEFAPIEKCVIEQHYIEVSSEKEVRVRKKHCLSNDMVKYFKTVKKGHGLVREENEIEISKSEFDAFKKQAIGSIYKERMIVNGIEFDFYEGENKGLVTFEIEFQTENDAQKELPEKVQDIILLEVTGNKKYSNYNLSKGKVNWQEDIKKKG